MNQLLRIPHPLRALLCFIMAANALLAVTPDNWEYRWGDSPFVDGVPLWTTPSEAANPAWQPTPTPLDPPGRNGQTNLWLRTKLPDPLPERAFLYVLSFDLLAQVYHNGTLIYAHGEFDATGSGPFIGWPWHLIPLPRYADGDYLYFRIFSDYPDIGLFGEVRIELEEVIYREILHRDLVPVALGIVLIIAGIGLLGVALFKRSLIPALMGLFLANLGGIPIQESQLKQLLIDAPLAWQFFAAANYFQLPVSMTAFIHARFGSGLWRLRPLIWGSHLLFVVLAITGAAAGLFNLSATYIAFDALALCSLLALTLSVLHQARRGSFELRLLAVGVAFTYTVLVYNGLTAHGFLPFAPRSEYLGPFVIGLCFIAIEIRTYYQIKRDLARSTRKLQCLNQTLEDRVARRTRQLELSNQTKDQFLAIIAHDLRGPTGALKTLLDVYAETEATLSKAEFDHLRAAANQVHSLLDDLLQWALDQRGELKTQPKPFALASICAAATQILQPAADAKSVAFERDIPTSLEVYADPAMIAAIFRNLLSNAIKFSTPNATIRIRAEATADCAQVQVIDTGTGMPAEFAAQLFAPRAAHPSAQGTAGETGSGLGLQLVREFIRRNHGTITARSQPNCGTTVTFTLPLRPPNAAA